MAYTTTITFPVRDISPTETIQLILVFTTDLTGSNRSWDAEDYDLKVVEYGKREASYDMEDAFLVMSTTKMKIGDPQGVLDNLLFGADAIAIATNKRAKVVKKINGVEKFTGNMIEDTIKFNEASMMLDFSAAPDVDVINKRMVFDEDDAPLDPLGYNAAFLVYKKITDIFHDIYKLINPSITFEYYQNWLVNGTDITHVYDISDAPFIDCELYLEYLFTNPILGIRTLGDILRTLSRDMAVFTGAIDNNRAFLKKLFYYNSSNLQTVDVLNRIKGYKYGLLDYVKFENNLVLSAPAEQGTFTELQDRFLSTEVSYAIVSTASMIKYNDGVREYYIDEVKDPESSTGYTNSQTILAEFWYLHRGYIQNCRVDSFTLRGVTYDFLKDFNYDGSKYQPISMVWNDADGTTECEAIYLGEL